MRKLLVVLGIVALCSAPMWADSVVDVDAWVKITAPNGAVERINANFLFNNNNNYNGLSSEIVAGSLRVESSGFMGTFSPLTPQGNNLFYLGLFDTNPLNNLPTDEIDFDYPLAIGGAVFTPGKDTINSNRFAGFYSCGTAACTSAYGTSWSGYAGPPGGNITEGSYVKTVPDGDSPLLLSLGAFGVFALAWRWRQL